MARRISTPDLKQAQRLARNPLELPWEEEWRLEMKRDGERAEAEEREVDPDA
jgi:hypothetical protein